MSKGFSLVELSIVLVILGLLTGGILGGQELIHAAEVRATMNTSSTYQTAYHAFRLKYNCIPGDCPYISDFYPAQLDGDGDGLISCQYFASMPHCRSTINEHEGAIQQVQ